MKGATYNGYGDLVAVVHFNPRTREGCDPQFPDLLSGFFLISIHAPVKGATLGEILQISAFFVISIHAPVKGATAARQAMPENMRYFNPRTREGCDVYCKLDKVQVVQFQSTHP